MLDRKCEFCNKKAEYDAKSIMGPWAYMCESHYKIYGSKIDGLFTKLNKDKSSKDK